MNVTEVRLSDPLPTREQCIREALRMLDYAKDVPPMDSTYYKEDREWWMAKANFWATLALAASPSHSNQIIGTLTSNDPGSPIPTYIDEDMRP